MRDTTLLKIARWGIGDDTGMSSKFLAACALGQPDLAENYTPSDPSDFGRCYRFAKLLDPTELGNALRTAAWESEGWRAIKDAWAELCDLYEAEKDSADRRAPKLYERMKELGL